MHVLINQPRGYLQAVFPVPGVCPTPLKDVRRTRIWYHLGKERADPILRYFRDDPAPKPYESFKENLVWLYVGIHQMTHFIFSF